VKGPAVVIILMLLLPGALLFAQTGETQSPGNQSPENQAPRRGLPNGESVLEESEIVLPEELLRVEEAAPEELDPDLPALDDTTMAALDTPLPEPGVLEVPPELFDVPPPAGQVLPRADTAAGSLYSNGLFGAGSMSYIVGAISLYRVGATPGFQFDFSHEARDGYNFEEPGNGFFDRNDQIGVSVSGRGESLGGEVEGRFTEEEVGFQGLSTYYSATARRVEGAALMDYAASPIATVTAGGTISTAQRIYNSDGATPSPRDSELVLSPEASLIISTETTDTTISADYRFRSVDGEDDSDDLIQTLRGSIGAETSFWSDLILSGDVGVAWRIGTDAVVPFLFGVTAILTEFLTLDVAGGYETTERSYSAAWGRLPFLSLEDLDGDLLLRQDAWFARGGVSVSIWDQTATLEAGAQLEERYGAIDIDAYDPASGYYNYDQITLTRLIPEASLLLEGSWWRSRFSWQAILGNRSNLEAPQTLGTDFSVFNQTETLRADAILSADLYNTLLAPELTLAGYVSATDSIEISVEVRDIFSFFLDDGRPAVGKEVTSDLPFIEPGFLFAVLTRISL
jgi:hypothetical protein